MKLLIVLSLIILVLSDGCESNSPKSYQNYKILSYKFKNQEEINRFQKMFSHNPVDVWTYEGVLVPGVENHIMVSPEQLETLENMGFQSSYEIAQENVQELVDQENRVNYQQRNNPDFFTRYHRYGDIVNFLETVKKEFPTNTQVFQLGESYEKRKVMGIKLFEPSADHSAKKNVWFSALQHSREWIAPATNLYVMYNLLKLYKEGNARVKKLFSQVIFHFVPVINPDGYEFSHTMQRMWRKNRRLNTPNPAIGVDLNRNWPFQWGGQGASRDPASDVYMGPSAGSEVEVQNVIRYFNSTKFDAAIDFHSYSQLLLRPWQYSNAQCPDETGLRELGAKMETSIRNNGGKSYRNIRGSQLYVHSGAMVDFFYGEKKIYGYTIELRPTGSPGFILPPSEIIPTGKENLYAVIDFAEHVLRK